MTETISKYEVSTEVSNGIIIEELKKTISILPVPEREEIEHQIKNELGIGEQENMLRTLLRVFNDEVLFLIELEKRRSNMRKARTNSEPSKEIVYDVPGEEIIDS